MARRSVHYEAALEDCLRGRGVPYVAVDEAKKALFGRAAIKSFDFVIYSDAGPNLLVDVKGRKFPAAAPGQKCARPRTWENWATRDDVESLFRWQGVFGSEFYPLLVFAYWLQGPPGGGPFEDVYVFRERHYAFLAIPLERYVALARPRSAKWRTISVPSAAFVKEIRPLSHWL